MADQRPAEERDRVGALSHDRPCGHCGHAAHHGVTCGETRLSDLDPFAGMSAGVELHPNHPWRL